MSSRKKLFFGLALAVVVVIGLGLQTPRKASALAETQAQLQDCLSSLSFVNIAQIQCTMDGATITFTDNDPTDGTLQYKAPDGAFCGNSNDFISLAVNGNLNAGNLKMQNSLDTITAIPAPAFPVLQQDGTGCENYADNAPAKPPINTVQDSTNILVLLSGTADGATSITGVTKGSLSGQTFTRYDGGAADNGTTLYASSDISIASGKCSGSILAVDSSGAVAAEYDISNKGDVFTTYTDTAKLPNAPVTGCGINRVDFGLGTGTFNIGPAIGSNGAPVGTLTCDDGSTPDPTTGLCADGTTPTSASEPTQPSCYTGGTLQKIFSLEWILCPALQYLDTGVKEFDNTIQGMLSFNTAQYLCDNLAGKNTNDIALNKTDANPTTQVTTCAKQTNGTYHAWSVMRDIASGLLVIIMLLIVISQALA